MLNNLFRIAVLAVIISGIISCSYFVTVKDTTDDDPIIVNSNFLEIKELPAIDSYGFREGEYEVIRGKVMRNESLYLILNELGVSPQTVRTLANGSRGVYRIERIQPGQEYLVYRHKEQKTVDRFILHTNRRDYILYDWRDGLDIKAGSLPVETSVHLVSGSIDHSLYVSLQEQGVDPILGNKLSEIFGWQIDFFRIYKGDGFKVLYEQQYIEGVPVGVGEILAAEFIHKGETFDAFYFETEERAGYFDKNGNGVQKALLKAPFRYSQRISSGFSHTRFHPVLKKTMPHYGVDYAAPLGTPVISVGDGEVIEARYRGPNGNIVKVRHNGTYTTAYLHLNGFARGIKPGRKVKQGEVIGYVGRTGRVTGVHLDYRIYQNGSPVNPLTIKLPPSKAISDEHMQEFRKVTGEFSRQLNQPEEWWASVSS